MSRKKDPDFLSWEDDIDLDAVLGEYTDNENVAQNRVVPDKCVYVCPTCSREYKTISGFRGHVTKKHQLNLKAQDHKKGAEKTATPKSRPSLSEEVQTVFPDAYLASLNNIQSKPIYNIFGVSTEAKVAKCCLEVEALYGQILPAFTEIFADSNAASCNEREKILTRLHSLRTNKQAKDSIISTIAAKVTEFSRIDINNFLQVFLLNLVGEVFRQLVKSATVASQNTSESLSDNDSTVLYYIAGYIISALEKKYSKLRNASVREDKLENVRGLISRSSETTFTEKFSAMIVRKDRGGLKKPCDTFFFMIREFENVVRKNVDMENLNATSMLKAPLKENILDSYMVKHYGNELFQDPDTADSYVEECMELFLTVRGFATAKLVTRKVTHSAKDMKRSSHSLRDALKSINASFK